MTLLYRKFASLDRADRHLLIEAAVLTALVMAGLRTRRLTTVRRGLERYIGWRMTSAAATSSRTISEVGWAIAAVSRRLSSATCLVQALVADTMLRRRRLTSELRIGVRIHRDATPPIESHAWVECNGEVAVGQVEHLAEFAVLTAGRR
jgi:hypothetical protein